MAYNKNNWTAIERTSITVADQVPQSETDPGLEI